MMNRLLDQKNPKDKFIVDTLLPHLVDCIEKSDSKYDIADQISSMYVFPYRTNEGTKIGSLKEAGVSWYFDKSKEKGKVSSGSYRIIEESVLTEKHADSFRKTFKEYCGITEFSNQAVIKDLLEQMSDETDYTSRWWIYAYDVFKLWNEEDFNASLLKATESMDNNKFLFLEDKYPESLKEKILEYGIFSDIKETSFKTCFWNLMESSEDKKKAIKVLINMGVPHTFVDNGNINEYLQTYFEQLSEKAMYPVESWEKEYELCELSHEIMLQIYKEDKDALVEIVSDYNISGGIVIKNILGAYVPLSWDLFYLSEDKKMEDDEVEDLDDGETMYTDSDLECLHIDEKEYSESFLSELKMIHKFSDAYKCTDKYSLGLNCCDIVDFYKWIWTYSKHKELIEHILYFFTNDCRECVSDSDVEFVLEVLACKDVTDEGYKFDIDLDAEGCFLNADVLNKISNQFPDIHCYVVTELQSFDVSGYLPQIIAAAVSDVRKIAADPIWDHVYLADEEPDQYDNLYVRCKRFYDEYEDILLLWKSSDEDSYIRALAKYVSEQYSIEVKVACAEAFDWKSEYLNLVKEIREFITETKPIVKESDVYGYIADMADVPTYGDERKLWKELRKKREKIICQKVGKSPINLEYWREFLSEKYKGRCQVCGKKIVTGKQNAHFYTYRIVKESENKLANLNANMFCLCPSCHGEMQYGSYMGQDMREVLEKAKLYFKYYSSKCEGYEMEDHFRSLVENLSDESEELEGFIKPIVCNVIVNGKQRKMAFSWEHFIMLTFILEDSIEVDEEEKEE